MNWKNRGGNQTEQKQGQGVCRRGVDVPASRACTNEVSKKDGCRRMGGAGRGLGKGRGNNNQGNASQR